MKIPNCENAVVAIEKLRDYCLSPTHRVGKHKARVFYAALQMTDDDADILQATLLSAVCGENALETLKDEYGQRYQLDFILSFNGHQETIRSAWIIRANEDFPRLTTCHIL